MAAYAALLSLTHIINQIQNHPRPPISLNKDQLQSLTQKVIFLQKFLEGYSNINGGTSEDVDALESRITEAAYFAEDTIESQIVDQIEAYGKNISSVDFNQGMQKVIEAMDWVNREITEIKGKGELQLHISYSISGDSSNGSRSIGENTMVGFDDVLVEEILDKLTGQQSNRQIIPIVGMGGIGKTTLARSIYDKPLIVQYFDVRGWATISQEYNSKEILLQVLFCLTNESLSEMSEDKLGEKLYKSLIGRRYLIVIDDIWSIEAWDRVRFFFPANDNGSRIVITTRLSSLASKLNGSCDILEMSFLDEDKSWKLLRSTVFGEGGICPLELDEIGKKIAKNCKGLPLSIVVIGGLVGKSNQTREHWQYIADNLNLTVNVEDSERCLKTLGLSYNELPVHLKPCFLYMGIFPEDYTICVSTLIRLWVAEGFLKPISGKSLEGAAKEYLKDLVDRNLVLAHTLEYDGNIKYCTIHDLLRDLCIKEAKKGTFLRLAETDSLLNTAQSWHTERRICIPQTLHDAIQSASLARSLIIYSLKGAVQSLPFRLCRVFNLGVFGVIYDSDSYSLDDICQLVNLRHLDITAKFPSSSFPSSVYRLWNLQTLVVRRMNLVNIFVLFDIWKMSQLRHVVCTILLLPDPPTSSDEIGFAVLENLQTLKTVRNFKCSEEVVNRIPNIKKLKICHDDTVESTGSYCLDNLCQLRKLESLFSSFGFDDEPRLSELARTLVFPHSLKNLTLGGSYLEWEEMGTMIGSLPHLQVLKLLRNSFVGPEWETVEGQFRRLKYLRIDDCKDLEYWRTEGTHFPCLEHIVLRDLSKFEEIPLEIGDISTLKLIELDKCTDSAIISAKEIVKEQEDLGNEGLQVRVGINKNRKVHR
ncbi:hypothetical protein CASFOL_025930 [Castilleja foliolosa]|uniref:NB-ARC domain-containing protein n=1 Tax=Castilleja foliolosa TaxID=1961234 RepID=A0ABD3CSH7_9LAMI